MVLDQQRHEIQELLFRFMRSFDEKDWAAMKDCLADEIDCDYSSFRGTPPGRISRDQYVSQRRDALPTLKTQHNISNISLLSATDSIHVKCNFIILRFHPDFQGEKDQYFHSYGSYQFILSRKNRELKISAITQHLLTNEGNPKLHGGVANIK